MPDQRTFCQACNTVHDPRVFCSGEDPDPVPDPLPAPGARQQSSPDDAGGPVMHDLLIDDIRQRMYPSAARAAVEEDVRARLEFGLRKYGQPLRAGNGRDALLDAYQEVLDCLVYLLQAMTEAPGTSVMAMSRRAELYDLYEGQLRAAFTLVRLMDRG